MNMRPGHHGPLPPLVNDREPLLAGRSNGCVGRAPWWYEPDRRQRSDRCVPEDLGGQEAYERFCERAGLAARPEGYGILLLEDDTDGSRWTAIDDLRYTNMLIGASTAGVSSAARSISTEAAWVARRVAS